MTHMMKLLGRTQAVKSVNPPDGLKLDDRADDVKYANIPANFRAEYDLRKVKPDIITPIVSQGSCGSCYAIAAADAMTMRLKLRDGKDAPKLSAQNVVSCSDYNQGCEGGYPFLVGKFGEDIGFVPEYCQPYTGADDACTVNCPADKPLKVYHATGYGYVGGYYGACNEVAMMEEIYKHGPVVVAINAPPDLFYYSGGVYSFTDTDKTSSNLNGVSRWEKTNHAILCVGWGTDNGVKYWIIKNSWGADWGEAGYFKLRRGTDEIASESMAVRMSPKVKKA
jgi:cathepsin C